MADKPVIVDFCCKMGGASDGYYRAGFDVVGVDIEPQPRYPFPFVQMDMFDALPVLHSGGCITDDRGRHWHLSDFAAFHASPPCQAFCALKSMTDKDHPKLICATRLWFRHIGLPYVIENVPGAPLFNPIKLCGTMFGLRTSCGAQLRRHRLFETNWLLMSGLQCRHHDRQHSRTISVAGHGSPGIGRTISVHGTHARDPWLTKNREALATVGNARECFSVAEAATAMGINWMPMSGLSQAIPPAYTEFIGGQLIHHV